MMGPGPYMYNLMATAWKNIQSPSNLEESLAKHQGSDPPALPLATPEPVYMAPAAALCLELGKRW